MYSYNLQVLWACAHEIINIMALQERERSFLAMHWFQRKHHNFFYSLLIEYMIVYSGQAEAPEVRCNLTDRHMDKQTW